MENFRVDCIFYRIALTPEQVLPTELNRLAIEVKDSDSRSERYLAEHGARCWEVDILPADEIEAALNADIESWINRERWKQRDREIERARARL